MEHMSEDARVLIRAAKEVHAERHGAQTFLPGSRLSFLEAAKRTGIRPDRQLYYDALEDLEYEGAIEWDESARYARGNKHYVVTQRGLHDLGSTGTSAGTVAIQDGQQTLFEGEGLRVSERNRSRGAELRAERIRWRGRSRSLSQASRSMDERLRKMRDQASTLDKWLHRHAEESKRWHMAWDHPPRPGG
jgi:hypothetical protein